MKKAYKLRPWTEIVKLHPDVEAGNTAVATYAIDLGALVTRDPNVPAVYREPDSFFKATHITRELRRLIQEVFSGLTGGRGDRVLQLRSPFGGGKSHTLAALYHAVTDPKTLNNIPELTGLPKLGKVAVTVFDGEKFDVISGKDVAKGVRVQTLWGWLAWQIAQQRNQPQLFELIKMHDEQCIAPGGDVIAKLLDNKPTLLLLDEVLKYLIRAGGKRVGNSTLQVQIAEFLDTLTREVARTNNSVLVYSLQASGREAFENIGLLDMLDHLTARIDAKREPVGGDEVLPVLKKRLLAEVPDLNTAKTVAEAYATVVRGMRIAYADTDAARHQAEDEAEELRRRIENAYPFHPALIDIMRERWASIPDFQRTRGALRFLAVCLYRSKQRDAPHALLGPGEIPIQDVDVRQAFFTEVGQREPFQPVLEADITGPNAQAKKVDARLQKENPNLARAHPAVRLVTAILMYSFGGLPKETGKPGETLPPGVTEAELLASTLGPDLERVTAQAILKEIRESRTSCLFLHFDGARYCFKTTPNVTKLIEDEAQGVDPDKDIKPYVKAALEKRLAGQKSATIWPSASQEIPDEEPTFLVSYLPPEFCELKQADQDKNARELLTQYGNRPRRYRNGLALAIPNKEQLEPLRHSTRYLVAIQRVDQKKRQLGVTRDQEEQLKERRRTEEAGLESALRTLYSSLWLLPSAQDQLLEKIEAAGRPLIATTVHERTMELLTQVARKVHGSLAPKRIVELFRLGEPPEKGRSPRLGVKTKEVLDSFFSSLGFPRLTGADVISKSIIGGVANSQFAYWGQGEPLLGSDGKYQVPREKIAFGTILREDEIDLDKGFIILTEGLPSEGPAPPTPIPTTAPTPIPTPTGPRGALKTSVSYTVEATREELFKAWNAIANLAEIAGKVSMQIQAESKEGFDPNKIRNAVEEPLEELGLLRKEQQKQENKKQ